MKSLYKLFIALSFLGLAACGSDSDTCSPCDTTADCDEGLYCAQFSGGVNLCANENTTTCTTY